MTNHIQAIIWDLDGVILDSAEEHRLAWHRMAQDEGLTFTDEQFWATFGMRNLIRESKISQVETTIPSSFLIPTDGIAMQDDHHYNMAGHRLWADRAFAGMAAKGLLPWAKK